MNRIIMNAAVLTAGALTLVAAAAQGEPARSKQASRHEQQVGQIPVRYRADLGRVGVDRGLDFVPAPVRRARNRLGPAVRRDGSDGVDVGRRAAEDLAFHAEHPLRRRLANTGHRDAEPVPHKQPADRHQERERAGRDEQRLPPVEVAECRHGRDEVDEQGGQKRVENAGAHGAQSPAGAA